MPGLFIFVLVILSLLVRVALCSHQYFFGSDDTAYLLIAKSIAMGQGFPAIAVIYPPVYPLFGALVFFLLPNVPFDFPSMLNYIFFGGLLFIPFYYLTKLLYDERIAKTSSLLIILFPALILSQHIHWASAEHIYSFFMAVGFLALWKSLNDRGAMLATIIFSICFTLAYLVKPEGLFTFGVAFLLMLFKPFFCGKISWKHIVSQLGIMFLVLLLVSLPYLVWLSEQTEGQLKPEKGFTLSAKTAGNFIYSSYHQKGRGGVIEYLQKKPYKETKKIHQQGGFFLFILKNPVRIFRHYMLNIKSLFEQISALDMMPFFLWVFIGAGWFCSTWDIKRLKKELFLFALLIPMFVLPIFWIGKRFLLPFIPILIIWLANGLDRVGSWLNNSLKKKAKIIGIPTNLLPFAAILFILVIISVSIYFLWPQKPYEQKLLGQWIRNNIEDEVTLVSRKDYVARYAGKPYMRPPHPANISNLRRFMLKHELRYFVIDDYMTTNIYPDLRFLMEEKNAPPWLKAVRAEKGRSTKAILYMRVK